jgi:hypothetical protein
MAAWTWLLLYAYRGRGLGRMPGAAIIVGYLAFVSALALSVIDGHVESATAILPAAITAGALPLMYAARRAATTRPPGGRPGRGWQRRLLLPGWSVRRMWGLSLILCVAIAGCHAASGPHLLLIGLMIIGPCCGLLTARRAPTAAPSCLALAPAAVSLAATFGTAVLQRQR